jgi:hypothetical protein
LEILAALDPQHGEAGVPFKDLEATARSRLNYRALTDALNALVNDGGATRVCEKPARLRITSVGRARLNEYRSYPMANIMLRYDRPTDTRNWTEYNGRVRDWFARLVPPLNRSGLRHDLIHSGEGGPGGSRT